MLLWLLVVPCFFDDFYDNLFFEEFFLAKFFDKFFVEFS